MPRYRLIGYYDDNGQVYDGSWEGADEVDAVAECRCTLDPRESEELVLVAILDASGVNVYDSDTASFAKDWPKEDE
jgi:hypothetical protein